MGGASSHRPECAAVASTSSPAVRPDIPWQSSVRELTPRWNDCFKVLIPAIPWTATGRASASRDERKRSLTNARDGRHCRATG